MSSADDREVGDAELEILQTRQLLGIETPGADPVEDLLARTLNRIEAGEPDPLRATARQVRHLRPAYWMAAAAVIVLVGVLGLVLWPSTPAFAAPAGLRYETAVADLDTAPTASAVLLQLAESLPADDPPGGPVHYIASVGWIVISDGETRSTILPKERQWWAAPDGEALAVERTGQPLRTDGSLDPDWISQSPPLATDRFPGGTVPALADLPWQREALRAEAGSRCESWADQGACRLVWVWTLASTYVLPAEARENLLLVLADEPSIRSLGETTDRAGRPALALAAGPYPTVPGSSIIVLLVSPESGDVLGTETITLESPTFPITEPTVTGFTTITESAMVGELEQTP